MEIFHVTFKRKSTVPIYMHLYKYCLCIDGIYNHPISYFFLVIYCFSDTIENKTILHFSMHVAYNSIDTFTIRYTKHI